MSDVSNPANDAAQAIAQVLNTMPSGAQQGIKFHRQETSNGDTQCVMVITGDLIYEDFCKMMDRALNCIWEEAPQLWRDLSDFLTHGGVQPCRRRTRDVPEATWQDPDDAPGTEVQSSAPEQAKDLRTSLDAATKLVEDYLRKNPDSVVTVKASFEEPNQDEEIIELRVPTEVAELLKARGEAARILLNPIEDRFQSWQELMESKAHLASPYILRRVTYDRGNIKRQAFCDVSLSRVSAADSTVALTDPNATRRAVLTFHEDWVIDWAPITSEEFKAYL